MKFREIFRFELAYQARRMSTWLFVAVMVVFGFLMIRSVYISDARSGVHFLNAPLVIAGATVSSGVIWLLMAAAVAGEAAARDVETRMHALVYCTPISKADYLGGRFLAAFVLNALTLLGMPAGILLALVTPGLEPGLLGPFRPAAYLTAYFFLALPFAFVATAFQFSWATRGRRAVAGYFASGFLLLTSHIGVSAVASLLGSWDLTKLLDVVGLIGIVSGQLDTWTPIEKNTRLIALEGALLGNRLIWVGAALGMLAFTYRRFSFGSPRPPRFALRRTHRSLRTGVWSRIRRKPKSTAITPIGVNRRISAPVVQQTFGLATCARQTRAIAWDSFRSIAKSRGGLTLVAVMVIPTVLFGGLSFMNIMGVPFFPRTGQVIRFFTPRLTELQTPWVIIPLLTLFYAGELVWRERDAGLSEMTDVAPVPEWVLFLGKFLGLGLVLVVWLVFLMAAGILMQVDMGNRGSGIPDLEVGVYLRALFGLQLANYLLFALLVLVVHVVVDQKYLAYLAALVGYGCMAFASRLGIEHNLLIYASDPGWTYTDMRGFEPFLAPWLWFKLYWAAWALLLAVAAGLLWARGRERGLRWRLHLARHRVTRPTAAAAATAAGLILTVGGFIFYNTNVLNGYRSASGTTARGAEYERRYGRYATIPQPRLTATNLHVEIYPERRQVDIRGTYRLVNRGAAAIDAIHLTTNSAVETGAVDFDRPATSVLADEELGHRIYALTTPLQPGDAVTLTFEVHYAPRGFANRDADASVVANGTSFTKNWLPAIGYLRNRELTNPGDRRAHGLPHRQDFASSDDDEARGLWTEVERASFEAVVGTDEHQIAVAPGTLRRTWTEAAGSGQHGRRYFHYVTDAPIQSAYKIFSAAYAVHEAQWAPSTLREPQGRPEQSRGATGSGQVAIRVFHHPGHAQNVDRMVRSARASLDAFTRQLGPYPYRSLNIVEHPGHGLGMHADAGTIDYEEGFSLINQKDPARGLDLVFYVLAHEVAHQWWGMQLAPAYAEGIGIVAESLATYSGLRVLEDTYGHEQMRRLLAAWRQAYEVPRTRAAVPLLRATNEAFLYRRKAPLVMYALSEYIGKAQVDTALRRLFEKHRAGTPPLATSLDLYRELQAVTPNPFQSLLHDLFEVNAYWELEMKHATARQTPAGSWQVTLEVGARKVVVDETGLETEAPMDDWVQVEILGRADQDEKAGAPLYQQMQRIHSGTQTITVTVPRQPTGAGIDPNHLLIDLDTDDNIRTVKID